MEEVLQGQAAGEPVSIMKQCRIDGFSKGSGIAEVLRCACTDQVVRNALVSETHDQKRGADEIWRSEEVSIVDSGVTSLSKLMVA